LEGYIALLERLLELQLVESVPTVQLTIRLLVPQGSAENLYPDYVSNENRLTGIRSHALSATTI
jgi:hypothetical protein